MKKLILILFCMSAGICYGDTAAVKKPAPKVNPDPEVISVSNYNEGKKLYPEDYVRVTISNPGLKYVEDNQDSLRLWVDGICYKNIKPLFIDHAKPFPSLIFKLSLDTARTSAWELFYAYPNYWTFKRDVSISFGTLKKEFNTYCRTNCNTPATITLHTTACWMIVVGYFIFFVFLVLIYRYGRQMIRDTGYYAANGIRITYKKEELTDPAAKVININDVPYSIARFQFMIWLIIIFAGIVHIWAITDIFTTPTGTALLLLGISGGTFYLGRLIDSSPAANPVISTAADPIPSTLISKGFMRDLLSDGDAISVHRLQFFMFTILLAFYFIWQVIYSLALPEFNTTMLLLMGISSGMYAGLKTLENR